MLFMQYKPPKLKKKSGDQDATPSKKSQPHGNPPGYHLVPKKSNFSGTYTLEEENSPERQRGSYQSQYRAGGRHGGGGGGGSVVRAPVPKSFSQRMMTSSHTSATPAGELPGLHYSYIQEVISYSYIRICGNHKQNFVQNIIDYDLDAVFISISREFIRSMDERTREGGEGRGREGR